MKHLNTSKTVKASIAQPLSILQKAHGVLNGQRQADYGSAVENMAQFAMGLNFLLAKKLAKPITAQDACLVMQALKMTRLSGNPQHEDSLIDNLGYGAMIEQINASETRGDALPGIL